MVLVGWEYLLGETCIAGCLVFSIFYFNTARKTDSAMKILKQLNTGIAVMFLFFFVSRIFDNPVGEMFDPTRNLDLFGLKIADAGLHGIFKYFSYYYIIFSFSTFNLTLEYFVNMFFLTGLSIATFFNERAFIPKTRHVFFIFLLACAFISFIYGPITGQMIDIFDPDYANLFALLFTILGFLSFAVIPLIYFIFAAKTKGKIRVSALITAFGFIFIIVDIHTVGHSGSGNWYRSVPCLVGFFFVGLGNVGFSRMFPAMLALSGTRHVCIVCRGEIKSAVMMCNVCQVFYCETCWNAIADAENQCWNCKNSMKLVKASDGLSMDSSDKSTITEDQQDIPKKSGMKEAQKENKKA